MGWVEVAKHKKFELCGGRCVHMHPQVAHDGLLAVLNVISLFDE